MLVGLSWILVCQLVGEILARVLRLPVPGPVLGMVLLLLALMVRGGVPAELRSVGEGLLRHLSLLFVPAGVGLVVHGARLRAEWLPISVAVLLSTVIALAITALVLSRFTAGRADSAE